MGKPEGCVDFDCNSRQRGTCGKYFI